MIVDTGGRLYGDVDPQWRRRLRFVSWISNLTVMAAGVAALIGRAASIPILAQWIDRPLVRPMQPATALLFVFAGLAAIAVLAHGRAGWVTVGRVVATVVIGGGAAIVAANIFDWRFPDWLVTSLEVEDIIGGEVAGRPAENVGAVMTAFGIAVLLLGGTKGVRHRVGQMLAAGAGMVGATVVIAFAYGDESLRGFPFGTGRMPISAAVLTIVLAVGIVTARPGIGLMGPIVSPWPGGIVLRRLLPLVLAGPPAAVAYLLAATTPETQTRWLAVLAVGVSGVLLAALFATAEAVSNSELQKEAANDITERATTAVGRDAEVVELILSHLSETVGAVEGLEVAVRYRPAEGWLGGDSALTVNLGDSRLGAVVIDVVGHGPEPALAAARLGDIIRHSLFRGDSLPSVVADSTWVLESARLMATLSLVEVDAIDGSVRYVGAGSPPIIHWSPRSIERYPATGPILMADDTLKWADGVTKLERGDVLLIYSDGLADPSDPDSVDVASVDDLVLAVSRCPTRSVEEIADWCVSETFGQAQGQVRDDISLIVIKRV